MLFINANVINEEFKREELDLRVEDGKIAAMDKWGRIPAYPNEEVIDLKGRILAPGAIDNHIHGAMGVDTMDANEDALQTISRFLAGKGVTSFLPTTMTMAVEHLQPVFKLFPDLEGAEMLGFHMEGPFINVEKKGAQNEAYIRRATVEEMRRYDAADRIKVITLAPEEPGTMEFIRELSDQYVLSIGHSTADYDTSVEAIRAGVKTITHCFNAMPPLHHRNPGVIGAAVKEGIFGEMITDGQHIHPAVVYANYKMFGADRMLIVSDALRAAGLADGEYDLGGQLMDVVEGVARTKEGNLAGGTSNVWQNMRNCIAFGIPESDALRMATLTPASLIGVQDRKGSLAIGKDADIVVAAPDLAVDRVYLKGKLFV